MKVDFSPVSFKSNSLNQESNNIQSAASNPVAEALKLDQEHAQKSKNKVELFNYRLHDDNWAKTYDFNTNTVNVKFPNSYDGTEYHISKIGKVVETNGWTSPVVIIEKHEELAKYVQAMKDYQMKSAGSYTSVNQPKKNVAFGADNSLWNGFTPPEKPLAESKPSVSTQVDDVSAATIDKTEGKSVVNDIQAAQTAVKTSAQETVPAADPKQKTTFKEKIANVWKFFTNLGQMTKAAIKGVGYAAATAASLLACSWLFNTLPKAFSKEGPKLVQVIKHPVKHIGKSGKIIAGLGAASVFAYHLIAGRLGANQKTAVIDHKLRVGHRDV